MELMLNERSMEEQFHNSLMLREAVSRIMNIRDIASRFGREVYCHRGAPYRNVRPGTPLVQALNNELPRNERLTALGWLTKSGPFWDDDPKHDPNEWFECNGEPVTEEGIAEAAYCSTIGIDRRMVSFTPSSWEYSPVVVLWMRDDTQSTVIQLRNYWDSTTLENDLRQAPKVIESWRQLEEVCRQRFQNLTFLDSSFQPIYPLPFSTGQKDRILKLLGDLDELHGSIDSDGRRSAKGQRLYRDHFSGGGGDLFSDSSTREKQAFRQELTFASPQPGGEPLFCTWHGKVGRRTPIRIHFSWPVPPGGKLYVAYVGLKITRD